MSAPTLRPYQAAMLDAIWTELAAGRNRLLVQAATGVGKTHVFSHLPDRLAPWLAQFPQNERRTLVIAHRDELIQQAAAKLQATNRDHVVMIEQADHVASPYADIVVASIQTLAASKFRRLHRLMRRMMFRVVIVDEVHHCVAPTYRGVLARLGFIPTSGSEADGTYEVTTWNDEEETKTALAEWDTVCLKDRLLVGFTATPDRSDAIGLNCIFQTIAFSYPIRQSITDGWLVPIKPYVVESAESLDGVKTVAGDFNQGQLATAVNTPERNRIAVKAWHDHAQGRPTLAFTVDVKHAHALADAFVAVGVRAVAVSGETPKDERRDILARYTRGELDVLCNCQIFTEGTDLPRTSCILHAKPTKSATLYTQMSGRALRLFDGKQDAILLDVVDIARKHSLQTAPSLYGLPVGLFGQGDDLETMSDEWDDILAEHPGLEDVLAAKKMTLEQLRVHVSTFDVWTIPDLGQFGTVVALNWVKNTEDSYRLEYPWQDGKETLEVRRDMLGHWEIACSIRTPMGMERGKAVWSVRQRVLANSIVSREEAAKTAEAFVRAERPSIGRLKDRNANWRTAPASPAQIAQLQKHKVPYKRGVTKGEASDLIDLAFSKKRRR